MKITLQSIERLKNVSADLIAIGCFEEEKQLKGVLKELDRLEKGTLRTLLDKDFKGKEKETFLLYSPKLLRCAKILLVGLGKQEKYRLETARAATGEMIKSAHRFNAKKMSVVLESLCSEKTDKTFDLSTLAQAVSEAGILANFNFDKYKNKKEQKKQDSLEELELLIKDALPSKANLQKAIQVARVGAESSNFARILASEPANVMTPIALAKAAQESARKTGVRCEIYDERWLKREKMNAILAVAQGSQNPPRFILLDYSPKGTKAAPVALVGKGVCFDSGGISIKPSDGMEKMKYDMSGGATVIAAIQALAQLGVQQRVVGIVPAVENMPSGTAQRPGDIIQTFSGKSIEVVNTDAEGRLILADALAYAQKFKPKAIIDLATLTGACVVALGYQAIGLMGTDSSLNERIKKAGERSGERVWELPVWDEYFDLIKSDVADIKNAGGRAAGTISGAMFLKEFVGSYPWAHLDIAGTAWMEKPHSYLGLGPTGAGVRLLIELIRNWGE